MQLLYKLGKMGSCASGCNSVDEVKTNRAKTLSSTKTIPPTSKPSGNTLGKIKTRQPILQPLSNNPLYKSRLIHHQSTFPNNQP